MLTMLEDNQVTLQVMSTSRFVAGIREEVNMWEKRLVMVGDVLDEWLSTQRKWIELEAIFNQVEIQVPI